MSTSGSTGIRPEEEKAFELIRSTGALHTGHFVLESGRHTKHYVSKDAVSSHPFVLSQLAKAIADQFRDADVQVVAAPAVGAIALGNWVAFHLGQGVRSIYAETMRGLFPHEEELRFERGYAGLIEPETRVLQVEDIITTGRTTKAVYEAIVNLEGLPVGIGLLWNRSPDKLGLTVPVHALVTQTFPTCAEDECPSCSDEVEIDTGVNKHGREFLVLHGTDPSGWPANRVA